MLARGSGGWLGGGFAFAAAAWLLVAATRSAWAWAAALLASLVLLLFLRFFRDPERAPGDGIVSPADGRVMRVDEVDDADLGRARRVAVFMSPLDVHVNRAPVAGTVERADHVAGSHLPAFRKESERNERFVAVYDGPVRAKTVQIAGTVARRIAPYVRVGDRLDKGQRIGLIRFGSRVDTLVPTEAGWVAAVRVGDRVRAGATTLYRRPS